MTKSPHEALAEDVADIIRDYDHQSYEQQAEQVMHFIYEALQEPTPEMHEAAADPFHKEAQKQAIESEKRYGKVAFGSEPFSEAMWQAMLAKSVLAPEGKTDGK